MSTFQEAREIINAVDAQMAKLFVRRMRAAESICSYKKEHGLPILDSQREEEVIAANAELIEDDTLRGYYVSYLKHLMATSRAYQYRLQNGLKVAYSGVEGAFAHIAAGKIFPQSARMSYRDFQTAYDSVVTGESDVAVLPIENSYAGEVGKTIDCIFEGGLFINGIYELKVRQHLLGVPGATLADIKTVTSHPQALAQCRGYIEMREFETEEASNTAGAAKIVAQRNDLSLAAIASAETADIYGLDVLDMDINKSGENTTRFAVLSRIRASAPAMGSSVLMFTVKHEVGSLAHAITIISTHGYNMTALRSRPLKKGSWQYYFYIEIDGRIDTDNGERMIAELKKVCDKFKVAGSFTPHFEI